MTGTNSEEKAALSRGSHAMTDMRYAFTLNLGHSYGVPATLQARRTPFVALPCIRKSAMRWQGATCS